MNQSFAIAAGHEETAETAAKILKAGGNAFDAMIAAFVVTWIAEPMMSGAGGGGFANLKTADGKTEVLDFFCQTPLVKRPSKEINFYPVKVNFGTTTEIFHVGNGSTAVPGAIAGIFELRERFGSLPMSELLQPAIELARNGVEINRFQYLDFQLLESIMEISPSSKEIFFDQGKLKPIGVKTKMPHLADFLENLAKSGSELFYKGEIAQKIANYHQENGGQLTRLDFENYQVISRTPLSFPFRNKTILTNPLPSIGGAMMTIFMKKMEQFEIPENPISKTQLLQYLKAFQNIQSVEKSPENLLKQINNLSKNNAKRGATTHISIVDKWGNAISLTASLGEGCGYMVEGTDIHLNNMLGEAALLPNGFHSWTPNTRLSSMMSPTLVLNEKNQIEIVTGSGGAGRIPFAIAQVLKNIIDYDLNLKEAINAPRVHLAEGIFDMDQEFGSFDISADISTKIWQNRSLYFGGTHSIQIKENELFAVGDERRDGVGLVY